MAASDGVLEQRVSASLSFAQVGTEVFLTLFPPLPKATRLVRPFFSPSPPPSVVSVVGSGGGGGGGGDSVKESRAAVIMLRRCCTLVLLTHNSERGCDS